MNLGFKNRSSSADKLLLCSIGILSVAPTISYAGDKPNVVIMLLDDISYGDLGCYGNTRTSTPYLDKLFGESVRLTNFHVAPMSTPTRAQLLTGRHCLENEADMVCAGRMTPRPDFPMMSEVFRANGYATGMFGKWHLGVYEPFRPEDRGFDEALYFPGSSIGTARDYWNNNGFDCTILHNGEREKYDGYVTDVWNDQAIKWMTSQQQAGKPFFCYLPSNLVHGPEFVEDEYKTPFEEYGGPYPTVYGALKRYDEICARVDAFLEKNGLRDNTIVIFFSDNGATDVMAKINNAGMRGYKTSLYDGGHRVPCFVRWPKGGWGGGRDFAGLSEVQDLFPTLMNACDLKTVPSLELSGVSLIPALDGEKMPQLDDRICFVQYGRLGAKTTDSPVNEGHLCGPVYGDAAVIWKNWRLVHNTELYDIATDPGQQNDIAERKPEIVKKLQKAYNKWWKDVNPERYSARSIPVGLNRNPVKLCVSSWEGAWIDFSGAIRNGNRTNGVWNLDIIQNGVYRIYLRRWPEELGLPITSAAPAGPSWAFAAGKALLVSKIHIEIDGRNYEYDVTDSDTVITADVRLPKGKMRLKTYMLDDAGETLAGVYYTDIQYLK